MARVMHIYFKDEVGDWIDKQQKGTIGPLINDLLKEHIKKVELEDLTDEELLYELEKAKIEKDYKDKLKSIKEEFDNGKHRRD